MGTRVWGPIRTELRRIAMSVPGVDAYQWELKPFKEEPITPWLSETLEKGNARTATLGTYGMVEERGIYMLNLHWPRNGLEADGEDLADAIRLAYRHGLRFQPVGLYDGIIIAVHARTAIPLPTKTIFPVRVEFFVRRATAQA